MSPVCTEHPILDLTVLIEMYGDDSRETIHNALSGFMQSAPKYINTILDASANQQLAALASAAHSLKSIAALIGANQLAEMCRQLEESARMAEWQRLASILQTLPESWLRLQQQLGEQLQQLERSDG